MLKYTWQNIDLAQYFSQVIGVKWHEPVSYYTNIRDVAVKKRNCTDFWWNWGKTRGLVLVAAFHGETLEPMY